MLTRSELLRYREATGFSLGQVEKDYVQHMFLMSLYRRTNELVFKGGTALQKAYGLNRFSEDLDFTLVRDTGIAAVIKRAVGGLNMLGCNATFEKKKDSELSLVFQIRAEGPLYDGEERTLTYISIEMSRRERVLLPVSVSGVVPVYRDIPPYLLPVMDLSEIAAEKIRALLMRGKSRDLYDLYFLVRRGIRTTVPLIDSKLSPYGKRFEKEDLCGAVRRIERTWERELMQLVAYVPEFSEVERTVTSLDFLDQ